MGKPERRRKQVRRGTVYRRRGRQPGLQAPNTGGGGEGVVGATVPTSAFSPKPQNSSSTRFPPNNSF